MLMLTLSRGKGQESIRLRLPSGPGEAEKALALLENGGSHTVIRDVESNVPNLDYRLYDIHLEDQEQFQKLQRLAEYTQGLSPAKTATFSGALDAEQAENLDEILSVAGRLDEYVLLPMITSDQELGVYLVDQGIMQFPDRYRPYINYASVGAEYREQHHGAYSRGGYVQKSNTAAQETLDGVFRVRLESGNPAAPPVSIILPTTFEQLERTRYLIGADGIDVVKITQVECLSPYLDEYLPLHGMNLNLEKLDELAENIRSMDQEDGAFLKYLSILEAEQPKDFETAYRLSAEMDDYERVPYDPEEYGKQVLMRIGADEELIAALDGFANFDELGSFFMQEDGVRTTNFGLIRRLSEPFSHQEDGPAMC